MNATYQQAILDDAKRWAFNEEQEARRSHYIDTTTPMLLAQYAHTPEKLAEAIDSANDTKRHPELFAALVRGDDAEAMRLLRGLMTAELMAMAENDAEDVAWELYDDAGASA